MPPLAIALGSIGAGALTTGLATRSSNRNSRSIADQQQQFAQQQFAMTQPAFKQAYEYYSNLLSGNQDQLMQAVGPDIDSTNLLFDRAQRNMIGSSYGRGGGLTAGLANLEGAKTMSLAQLIGRVRQGAASALSNLATGNQNAALSALAGAQQGQFQNQYLVQQAMGGIGSFITRLLSNPALFQGNNSYKVGLTMNPNGIGTNSIIPGLFANARPITPIPRPILSNQNFNYLPSVRTG